MSLKDPEDTPRIRSSHGTIIKIDVRIHIIFTSRCTMARHPYIPPHVFFRYLSESDKLDIDCKDISYLRLVCKEFSTEATNASVIENCIKSKFPELYSTSPGLTDDLLTSDFNFIELERILQNMKHMRGRMYGEKYGHYFKQRLIRECANQDERVEPTLNVFHALAKYSVHLMTQQTCAPTDLEKYVCYWVSDYMYSVCRKNMETLPCNRTIMDFISLEDTRRFLRNSTSCSLFKLYEVLLASLHPHLHHMYLATHIVISNMDAFNTTLHCWITALNSVTGNDTRTFVIIHIFAYINTALESLERQLFQGNILNIFLTKAQSFITYVNNQTESDTLSAKLMTVCNKTISLILS